MVTYKRIPIEKNVPYFFDRSIEVDTKVNVNVGDMVYPETIIANQWKRSGFRVFDLAELFNTDPAKVDRVFKKPVGSRVYKGDELVILREWFGLKEKFFRSPINGVISDYNAANAKLTLQYLPEEVKLTSGVFGKVSSVIPGQLITVGTRVNILAGVVSFGVRREGSLIEVGYPDIPIQADQISPKHEDKIIFGGTKISLDALYKALSIGVKGVITGAMDYADFVRLIGSRGRLENIGVSLFLTEGFGSMPIYPPIYDFLKESEFRHTILLPSESIVAVPVSSEVLTEDDLPVKTDHVNTDEAGQRYKYGLLEQNMKVRVLVEQSFGAYGIVSRVDKSANSAEVTLEKGKIIVPIEQLEIIGEATQA